MLEWSVDAHGLPRARASIYIDAGTLVARVEKTLYVRLKSPARQA
jgi:hypothetical protein